jgi:hypothetical protein
MPSKCTQAGCNLPRLHDWIPGTPHEGHTGELTDRQMHPAAPRPRAKVAAVKRITPAPMPKPKKQTHEQRTGHSAVRNARGQCVPCTRAYNAAYRALDHGGHPGRAATRV